MTGGPAPAANTDRPGGRSRVSEGAGSRRDRRGVPCQHAPHAVVCVLKTWTRCGWQSTPSPARSGPAQLNRQWEFTHVHAHPDTHASPCIDTPWAHGGHAAVTGVTRGWARHSGCYARQPACLEGASGCSSRQRGGKGVVFRLLWWRCCDFVRVRSCVEHDDGHIDFHHCQSTHHHTGQSISQHAAFCVSQVDCSAKRRPLGSAERQRGVTT